MLTSFSEILPLPVRPDRPELRPKILTAAVSERGVVFFRAQTNLTNELQKQLIHRLGELAGKPSTSSLHIHPILNSERELGGSDPEISTISSVQFKKLYKNSKFERSDKKQSSASWHADISFEPVPADYTSLRLTQLPKTGGDTLWASGYELYDRISEPYQKFLEGLTATFAQPGFQDVAKRAGFDLYDKPRGSPENVGSELTAIHPVVRTNPVTGWKSIFPVGGHVTHVNGVTEEESKHLLDWFVELVHKNHDLQVRLKWQNEHDIGEQRQMLVFEASHGLTCVKPSGTTVQFSILPHTTLRAKARGEFDVLRCLEICIF
jgi:alpha-ketoglutarate-dependent taurine dioxygenase